ncbi:hypothetical protein ACS0TY_026316 [Phlomoides rotata]
MDFGHEYEGPPLYDDEDDHFIFNGPFNFDVSTKIDMDFEEDYAGPAVYHDEVLDPVYPLFETEPEDDLCNNFEMDYDVYDALLPDLDNEHIVEGDGQRDTLSKRFQACMIPNQLEAIRRHNVSYAEITRNNKSTAMGKSTRNSDNSPQGVGFKYTSSEEDRNRLKGSFTGILKEDLIWLDVGYEIQEAGGDEFKINSLGGELVFIQPLKDLENPAVELQRFSPWFQIIREWQTRDVVGNRLVWTQWFGIPLHAWKIQIQFFSLMACRVGGLVRVDEDTIRWENLQSARMLIRTPYLDVSKFQVNAEIDGEIFQIRVKEEPEMREDGCDVEDSEDVLDGKEPSNADSVDSSSEEDEETNSDHSVGGSLENGGKINDAHGNWPSLADNADFMSSPVYQRKTGFVGIKNNNFLPNPEFMRNSSLPLNNSPQANSKFYSAPCPVGLESENSSPKYLGINHECGAQSIPAQEIKELFVDLKGPILENDVDGPVTENNPQGPSELDSPSKQNTVEDRVNLDSGTSRVGAVNSHTPLLTGNSKVIPMKKHQKRKEANSSKKYGTLETIQEEDSEEDSEITSEARRAWEVGKRLGLISKVTDEDMISQMEYLERKDRQRSKKTLTKPSQFIHVVPPGWSCKSKIDRMFVNTEWLKQRPNQTLKGLRWSFSDHIPLTLLSGSKDWGPRPFHFLNSWLEHPQFTKFFQEKLNNYSIEGWAAYRLKEKLKLLKKYLREWNKCIFGDIDHNIESTMKEIEVLDRIDDAMGLEEAEVIQRNKNTVELIRFVQWKEKLLAQKAKAKWLKEGDVNSSYFHGWINKNRKANMIEGLLINDRWTNSVDDVKKGIREHFEQHFRKPVSCRPQLPIDIFSRSIDECSNQLLTSRFTEEEIKEAVWTCDSEKSPSPDGYSFGFIK